MTDCESAIPKCMNVEGTKTEKYDDGLTHVLIEQNDPMGRGETNKDKENQNTKMESINAKNNNETKLVNEQNTDFPVIEVSESINDIQQNGTLEENFGKDNNGFSVSNEEIHHHTILNQGEKGANSIENDYNSERNGTYTKSVADEIANSVTNQYSLTSECDDVPTYLPSAQVRSRRAQIGSEDLITNDVSKKTLVLPSLLD